MTTKSNHARIMLKNPPQISANKNIEKKKPQKISPNGQNVCLGTIYENRVGNYTPPLFSLLTYMQKATYLTRIFTRSKLL